MRLEGQGSPQNPLGSPAPLLLPWRRAAGESIGRFLAAPFEPQGRCTSRIPRCNLGPPDVMWNFSKMATENPRGWQKYQGSRGRAPRKKAPPNAKSCFEKSQKLLGLED